MIEYVHIYLSIIAGIAYLLVAFLTGQDPTEALYILIVIIIAANILGRILRAVLRKNVPATEDGAVLDNLLENSDTELSLDAESPEGDEVIQDEFDF